MSNKEHKYEKQTIKYIHKDGVELTKNKDIKNGEEVLLKPWDFIIIEENI